MATATSTQNKENVPWSHRAIVVLLLPLPLTEVVGYGLVLATAAVGEYTTTISTGVVQGLMSDERAVAKAIVSCW